MQCVVYLTKILQKEDEYHRHVRKNTLHQRIQQHQTGIYTFGHYNIDSLLFSYWKLHYLVFQGGIPLHVFFSSTSRTGRNW